MKNVLTNPVMVNLEVALVEDLIRIIGQAIHRQFSHNDIATVQQILAQKRQEALEAPQQVS